MNIVTDPKSAPVGSILSPEANQAAALATATGVVTVDLDAVVANWRKLEKTAVPAECAAVIKADSYGCGADPGRGTGDRGGGGGGGGGGGQGGSSGSSGSSSQ